MKTFYKKIFPLPFFGGDLHDSFTFITFSLFPPSFWFSSVPPPPPTHTWIMTWISNLYPFLLVLVVLTKAKERKREVLKNERRWKRFYFSNTNPYIFLLLSNKSLEQVKEWQEFVKWKEKILPLLPDKIGGKKGREKFFIFVKESHLIFLSVCSSEHGKRCLISHMIHKSAKVVNVQNCNMKERERENLMLIPSFLPSFVS